MSLKINWSLGFPAIVILRRRSDGLAHGPVWMEDCAHDVAAVHGSGHGLEGCLRTCTELSVRSMRYKAGYHCTISPNCISDMVLDVYSGLRLSIHAFIP